MRLPDDMLGKMFALFDLAFFGVGISVAVAAIIGIMWLVGMHLAAVLT